MLPWTELPARLRQVDVNLAPLVPDSVFNESKSAIKWLEAALVETPTIATPTEPFVEAIDDGRTGILATTPEEWLHALETLLDDADLRSRMGARARRDALLRWAPALQGRTYVDILRAAAVRNLTGEPRTSTWKPVADDESWTPLADGWVDPYPPGGPVRRSSALMLQARAVARVLRHEGPAGVARRVRQRLR
jgi:hypothetical protein